MFTKPLAILKDSLREAWDSKTLLVMLVLAGLFLVGVASIGYTPAPPRTVFEDFAEEMSAPILRINKGKFVADLVDRRTGMPYAHPKYTLTTFRTIREGSHEATGEHEFTLTVTTSDPKREFEKGANDAKNEPAKDAPAGGPDVFERLVAAWHDSGSGNFVRLEDQKDLDPMKWQIVAPVTDDMVREFFAAELERRTQVPITAFERLPAEKPGERVYKITTGPSAEPRVWPVKLSVLFGAWQSGGAAPLGILLYGIQDVLISWVGGLAIILIAVIVTSFFIPNMLRPGSVVTLLSKPVRRTTLLLFKYLGGLFFVLILSTFVVGGVWLITGIRAGVWAPGVFIVIPLMTFSFAILYAVSTAAAVWSRNSIVAILVTLAFAGLLWLVGKAEWFARDHQHRQDTLAELRHEEPKYEGWSNVAVGFNNALPRWHDIDRLTGYAVAESLMTIKQQEARGTASERKHLPSWAGTIGVTLLWIVGFLALACWRFSVKDY
ncbi:MAG: ABC transporter permease [Zavarzinella sp.]|nr:ABC transporter permease [Zavarzinella sp.]